MCYTFLVQHTVTSNSVRTTVRPGRVLHYKPPALLCLDAVDNKASRDVGNRLRYTKVEMKEDRDSRYSCIKLLISPHVSDRTTSASGETATRPFFPRVLCITLIPTDRA